MSGLTDAIKGVLAYRRLLAEDPGQAGEILRAMVEQGPVYVRSSSCTAIDLSMIEVPLDASFAVCVGILNNGGQRAPKLIVHPDDFCRAFGWSQADAKWFMAKVILPNALNADPRNLHQVLANSSGKEIAIATTAAAKEYEDVLYGLATPLRLWCVRALFFDQDVLFRHFDREKLEEWLDTKFDFQCGHADSLALVEILYENDRLVAEALIKILQKLGMKDEQIREDFLFWLRCHATTTTPLVVAAVANASIFDNDERERQGIMKEAAPRLIERLMRADRHMPPFTMARLVEGGLPGWHGQVCTVYADGIIDLLAHGYIGAASEQATLTGWLFDFPKDDANRPRLELLAAWAFEKAYEAGRYGIAAGLVNEFGGEECLDEEMFEDRIDSGLGDETAGSSTLRDLVAQRRAQIFTIHDRATKAGHSTALDWSLRATQPVR